MNHSVYLPAEIAKQYKQKAKDLSMTEGELTQKLIRSFLSNPEDPAIKIMKLLKDVNDFFTVLPQPSKEEIEASASMGVPTARIKRQKMI